MAADAGLRAILNNYSGMEVSRNGTGVSAEGGLDVQVGRLASALERQANAVYEAGKTQGVVPVNVGPLDFLVTAGQPKLKAHRSTTSDNTSPQEGYVWFVSRLTLAGMNTGDIVNLLRPSASAVLTNSQAVATFTPTTGCGAGLGVGTIQFGPLGLVLWPDDTLNLLSGGTLAATEIILTGVAIQVAVPYLAEYLL